MKADRVGSVIKELLKDTREINGVYPVVASFKTTRPFAVYARTSVSPTYSKLSRLIPEYVVVRIDVAVYGDSYESGIETMGAVHNAIQGKNGVFGDVEVKSIMMVDSSEDFDNDVYIQVHTYELIIY